jgi:hypothetical protein
MRGKEINAMGEEICPVFYRMEYAKKKTTCSIAFGGLSTAWNYLFLVENPK